MAVYENNTTKSRDKQEEDSKFKPLYTIAKILLFGRFNFRTCNINCNCSLIDFTGL